MPSRIGDKILGWLSEGNPGVSQILIESPYPTLERAPCLRTSLPWSILRHAYDPLEHSRASQVMEGPFIMRHVMNNVEEAEAKGKQAREDMIRGSLLRL